MVDVQRGMSYKGHKDELETGASSDWSCVRAVHQMGPEQSLFSFPVPSIYQYVAHRSWKLRTPV